MKHNIFKIGPMGKGKMVEYKSKHYTMTKTYTRSGRLMYQHLEFNIIRRSIGALRKAKVQIGDCVMFQRKKHWIYELDEAVDGMGNFLYGIRCKHETDNPFFV